jgi:membrane-bound lytic murein transglycosylase D
MLLYHIAKAGETLWRIAMSHNVGVQDLKKQNNLISDRIRPGQKLLLPRDSNAIVAVEVWAKLRP